MSSIRKVKGSAGFPSRRVSSDPLQPEGQDKDFSTDLEEFNEAAKNSVAGTESSEFTRIREQRRKERELALKKRKEKEEEKETSDSEEEETRSNKVDYLI